MNEKNDSNDTATKINESSKIDELIYLEKKKKKKIESLSNDYHELYNSISKCLNSLSSSMKGSNVNAKLDDMRYSNKKLLNKFNEKIDDEMRDIKKTVAKLYREKDKIINNKDDSDK